MNQSKAIVDYLEFISKEYGLDICINDFAGFLYADQKLANILQPYIVHKNPFCMHIKSNKELFHRCLHMKKGILKKSEKIKDCFYGMCYCGIEEYIVPIICNDIVIGVIYAGEFFSNKELSYYRIKKVSQEYDLDLETLTIKFNQSTQKKKYNTKLIRNLLQILSAYISNIYTTLVSTHKNLQLKESKTPSPESYILFHAVEFIKQNYHLSITTREISKFCHCSDSYLSHIFKKNTKVNIKAYINKIRIEQSKVYLLNSTLTIAEISHKIGFNDPNYFSSVFSNIIGTSPTNFRKSFQ